MDVRIDLIVKKYYLHIARLAIFIAALQVLNLGLFVQDFQQLSSSSTTISDNNIINSVFEYVSEVVLKNANAVPESNNNADRNFQANKHFTVKIIQLQDYKIIISPVAVISKQDFPLTDTYTYLFSSEINPPPPKA